MNALKNICHAKTLNPPTSFLPRRFVPFSASIHTQLFEAPLDERSTHESAAVEVNKVVGVVGDIGVGVCDTLNKDLKFN